MIAFDAATHSPLLTGTSNNITHVTSGINRTLLVWIYSGADNVTAVTYNGVSATLVNKVAMVGGAAGQYLTCYILVNPASGSNTVTITTSSSLSGYASVVSYTGTRQAAQPDAQTTQAVVSVTSLTTSLTTLNDKTWLAGFAYSLNAISAGAGTTLRGGSVPNVQSMDSNGEKTPPGSYSLITTQTPAGFAGHLVVSLSPFTGNTGFFMVL